MADSNPQLAPDALSELAAGFHGTLVDPDHPKYEEARAVWNGMIDRRPALVARCRGAADVMDAVTLARDQDVPISVRGGGHSVAGSAVCDGGLVIDLSEMRAVRVDPAARKVWVQGGATWADVDRETQAFGLAAPGGVVSTTGVAGLTLGGGYGHMRHKHGLSSDNLAAAQVITADGDMVMASPEENPDLLWALRGGGGHFGVVTDFQFNLHRLGPEIMGLGVFYSLDEGREVIRQARDFAVEAPDEITFDILLWSVPEVEPFPPELQGTPVVILGGMYTGSVEDGERALAPLRGFGSPLLDISAPQTFVQLQSGFDPFFPEGLRYYWKSLYLDGLEDAAIDNIIENVRRRPSPRTVVPIRPRAGALRRQDPGATAFAERSSPFMLSIDSTWEDPADDEANIRWTREFWTSMKPWSSNRMYFNFAMGEEGEDVARATFGPNYDRLLEVKDRYDPDGIFGPGPGRNP
jgi:FAD/FMN-containing dehydrogenase